VFQVPFYDVRLKDGDYRASDSETAKDYVICLQVHGDAAVSGQGVVQETLAFSQVPHFNVGGSLHLVVNNQVGYTTPCDRARSSRYCSDVAKTIGVPAIHVNGDDPEAVVRAARLAWNYRKTFHRDIFVDVICFRKYDFVFHDPSQRAAHFPLNFQIWTQ